MLLLSQAQRLKYEFGITAAPTEINVLGGVTPGTVVAGKAVVVDSNKDITEFTSIRVNNIVGAVLADFQVSVAAGYNLTLIPDASGDLILQGLASSDPTVAGALWSDSGTLKVSSG